MNRLEKVLYTAKAHTTGGRAGMSRSSDGRLEVRLSRPGSPGTGTNPEQLFAAGWSACFESAMEFAARNMKITLPADHAVDAEDLQQLAEIDDGEVNLAVEGAARRQRDRPDRGGDQIALLEPRIGQLEPAIGRLQLAQPGGDRLRREIP